MEQKIKKFHAYQLLNGLLLLVVISLLLYALYPYFSKEKIESFEDIIVEDTVEKSELEISENEESIKIEEIQEKKGQTVEEAIIENEEILEPKKPALVYRTIIMEKTEKADIPTLDFAKTKIKEKEFIGDMRIRGVDCSHLEKGLRIKGDLHITGTGIERCWLPKGLSVVGSVFVKKLKSIIFQNDLKIQEKIYLEDDICVSVPLNSSEKVVLSDGINICN